MKKRDKKRTRSGRCVHCLQHRDDITDDHLFPRSWYPDTTPPNLEKWKIPACDPCNKAYGKIESDLRLNLAASLDQSSPAAAGIWKKVLDSLNPDRGLTPLDRLRRKQSRERFLKRLRHVGDVSMENVLPEINPARPKGDMAFYVSAEGMHRFVEKLVRGTVYLTERRYVEKNKKIGMSFMNPEDAVEIQGLMEQFGVLHERGLAIRIRKAVAAEVPDDPIFVFDIWNQYRVYAYVEDAVESAEL